MATLNGLILSVTRKTKRGFTVGEIFDRLVLLSDSRGLTIPQYNSVRARVSELVQKGALRVKDERKDPVSHRTSMVFVRN